MCGIAGFVNLDGAPASLDVVARMTDIQRHRGPDDQGIGVFSLATGTFREVERESAAAPAGFEGAVGFNRLKILDLTEHGHQPMANADGSVIVAFNGEVYNAFDFKPELEAAGYRFRSRTDTEVLLYLYERFGIDGLVERLNGMFAIAIIDLRRRELHLVRDHLGIKPLYWAQVGRTVLFASEAKAFLEHPGFTPAIDGEVVDEYLAFRYASGEGSLLEGVRQLRPGHTARITRDGVQVRRYWSIPDHVEPGPRDDEAALDGLARLLGASVSSQLLSDVKVGCQLSGGIDSSLVSVLARSGFDADMDTFSVIFDDPAFSEEPWITEAARVARADSHRYRFTSRLFFDSLDRASWHMDQPISHPNSLGIWLIAEKCKPLVTVLLSGEGADEVFGGYTRFYYARLRPKVSPWIAALKRLPSVGRRLDRQFGGDPVAAFITASLFERPEGLAALRPGADFGAILDRRRAIFEEGQGDHVGRCLKYEMQTYLVDLLVRQDKMTMAHSVENRVPFLDRRVVDFARALPLDLLVSDRVPVRDARMRGTKVIVKRLAGRTFGDRFVHRPKSGFGLPLADYFRDARFTALMEERLLPGMSRRGLVDAAAVRQAWRDVADGRAANGESLWISVALELWAQAFVDGRRH